jgi:alpha-glucosidase
MFVSHEYFHAFNVKRLRPVELGPFDYEKEPRTTGLWVAEGLTTYYGDLLVARAGFCDTKEYLARVSSHIDKLQKSPGRLVQTLNQASHDVWAGGMSGVGGGPKTISYYVKGPVVGFLLDAKIQRATKGTKSLDDVMRLAYRHYGGDKGFTADQFRQAAEEVAGIDMKEPFHQWLATTEELDYAEALDWFGLRFQDKSWRLEVRENATEAQRGRLERWLAKTEYRAVTTDNKGLASKVTAIPADVIKRYKLDTTFYKKHLDYKGFSILSSEKVSDEGLYEARYLIDKLLCEREDLLKAMIKNGARFMVMAPTEMTTHVPEQRHLKNDPKTNWDTRARGLGGKLSSCGEENLLNLKGDRYRQENILIHEFNHAIHSLGLRTVDPTFQGRLKKTYDSAMEKGLWKGTYVATNPSEYWAEGAQAYFDCMRPQFGANTREKLEKYDPGLFALVDEVYKQSKYRYVRYDQRKNKAAAQEAAATPGALMLIGGRHQDLPNGIRDAFFELAGGKKAKIVVIPTAVAHADEPKSADEFTKPWQDLKPQSVTVLHTRDRKTADDPAFVKPLTEATAVFFTNGHRDRIFNAYRGTLFEKELKKLLARGGLIGGTGTGAAVLGEFTIDRANPARLTEPGLGLLPGILIEDRSEFERFDQAIAANAGVVGLNVDSDTALVIRGKVMRVIGERTVTVKSAKKGNTEAATRTLKAGASLDLLELRGEIQEKESPKKVQPDVKKTGAIRLRGQDAKLSGLLRAD